MLSHNRSEVKNHLIRLDTLQKTSDVSTQKRQQANLRTSFFADVMRKVSSPRGGVCHAWTSSNTCFECRKCRSQRWTAKRLLGRKIVESTKTIRQKWIPTQVDSRFQTFSVFRIPAHWIPDSNIKNVLDSGFQHENFSGFRIPLHGANFQLYLLLPRNMASAKSSK